MDKEYTDKMEVAKKEGAAREQELIRRGEEEARTIITKARNEAQQTMLNWRSQLKTESAETQQRLQYNIDEFVHMIIKKILGRGSH
jgi:F0F1-type ATP synthase membrane subunit b/b'